MTTISNRCTRTRASAIRLAIAAAGVAATLTASTGIAAPLYLSEMRDSDLADMRGRFVSANHVLFFGVEMYTRWQTIEGNLHTAGLRLDVDFSRGGLPVTSFRPVVSIAPQASAVSAASNGNRTQVNGAGLNNVTGIAQGIQVAGDGNRAVNNLSLNVSTGTRPVEPQAANGTTSPPVASAQNGDSMAQASVGQNGLGVSINIPGHGQVMQQIRGGGHGIMQSVQVLSNMNNVQNVMQINAGLRAITGVPTANIGAALQNLRGIPMQGTY